MTESKIRGEKAPQSNQLLYYLVILTQKLWIAEQNVILKQFVTLCMFTCVLCAYMPFTISDLTAGCTHDWEQMEAVGVCMCVLAGRRQEEEEEEGWAL